MPKVATAPELEALLAQISKEYPEVALTPGERFSWHPGKRHISFQRDINTEQGSWALLHELGHALLDHKHYHYDIELLQLEVAAWDKARALAKHYGIEINEDHIQDCLDTYRDWLHMRATCPTCFTRSLQASPRHYRCFNCGSEWQISRSRLCRPYRLQTVPN